MPLLFLTGPTPSPTSSRTHAPAPAPSAPVAALSTPPTIKGRHLPICLSCAPKLKLKCRYDPSSPPPSPPPSTHACTQVPECPAISATASPGTSYLDAVLGSAPPEYMFTLDDPVGSASVANYVDGMFAIPKGVVGTPSTSGVTLGVPGLLPADNRTAALVSTGAQGSISFPSMLKVGAGPSHPHVPSLTGSLWALWSCVTTINPAPPPPPPTHTLPPAIRPQLDPELGGTFQFWIRVLTSNANSTAPCTIVSDRVVSPVDGSVSASFLVGLDSSNRLRATFWTSAWPSDACLWVGGQGAVHAGPCCSEPLRPPCSRLVWVVERPDRDTVS
jgi:hypothetical protein